MFIGLLLRIFQVCLIRIVCINGLRERLVQSFHISAVNDAAVVTSAFGYRGERRSLMLLNLLVRSCILSKVFGPAVFVLFGSWLFTW